MIRISKLADYAVVILAEMARQPAVVSTTAIAASTYLPETTVAKIMKSLTKANILSATRGATGGYQLLRAADEISICDIIEAVDGPIGIVDCTEESRAQCQISNTCKLQSRWAPVNERVRAAISQTTLADMLAAHQPTKAA